MIATLDNDSLPTNVTIPGSSSRSNGDPNFPWRHRHLQPLSSGIVLDISHVENIQFSADSELIIVLSKPPGTNTLVFYAWYTAEGKYVNKIVIDRPVSHYYSFYNFY
jgi:hypothetical protein